MTSSESTAEMRNGEAAAPAPDSGAPPEAAALDPETANLDEVVGSIDGLVPDLLGEAGTLAGEGDPLSEAPAEAPAEAQAETQADAQGDPAALPFSLPSLAGPAQSEEDAERERMQLLVSHFDEQQMSRYAAFRRANIRRAAVRKYASQLLNQPISNSVAVVLAGMSKVLIGDIIELARDLQEKEQAAERKQLGLPQPVPGGEPEPLLPSYIREAWRIYKQETGTVPGPKTKPGSANRFF